MMSLIFNTTDRTFVKSISFNNTGATESLSRITFGTTSVNNYKGDIRFSTKGNNDLYNDPLTEKVRITSAGEV